VHPGRWLAAPPSARAPQRLTYLVGPAAIPRACIAFPIEFGAETKRLLFPFRERSWPNGLERALNTQPLRSRVRIAVASQGLTAAAQSV
jgi:hypothetical protein